MNKRNFKDVTVCPVCHSNNNTYVFNTDEIEFSQYNNIASCHVSCYCMNCHKNFDVYIEFNYEIVSDYISE